MCVSRWFENCESKKAQNNFALGFFVSKGKCFYSDKLYMNHLTMYEIASTVGHVASEVII